MNYYLDIDGTLLTKEGKQMPNLRGFLQMIFSMPNTRVYWLTTHCKNGDTDRVFRHISNAIEPDLLELLKQVKPTKWETLKTEAINFNEDFLWFDDWIMEAEKEVLRSHKCESKWIKVEGIIAL